MVLTQPDIKLIAPTTHITVSREVATDLDTPVSLYLKLAATTNGPSFLLESVTGGEQVARYSFIGIQPKAAFVIRGRTIERHSGGQMVQTEVPHASDPLDILREELNQYAVAPTPGLPRFVGGMVGYLGYENVQFFEPTLALPQSNLPDGIFLLADTIIAIDHTRGRTLLMTTVSEEERAEAEDRLEKLARRIALAAMPRNTNGHAPDPNASVITNITREKFEENVRAAKEYIAAGDIFQVVLSQKFQRATAAQPFEIYRALRRINPSPYMFFFNFKDLGGESLHLIGASPEILTRLEHRKGQRIGVVRPIAGTRPRGATPEADFDHEQDLLADPKERAEHVMLVDLGRNDLGRVTQYGTVNVDELMTVERYSHVMHIVSHVTGLMRDEADAYDLIRATFPAGTVSGAPKVRAMEIIAELEGEARGPYAGLVGYFGFDGSMDTCIALRTMWVRPAADGQGNIVHFQSGGGIVADSVPANEYDESMNKARAIVKAIEAAEASM
jgi:anthranilate synthase component 1